MAASVLVLPSGIEIEVRDGESLMGAAQRQGYRWPTLCGGQGTCRTCFVRMEEGADRCSPIGELEREGIQALRKPLDGQTRLACQLQLAEGRVTVTKRGVRQERN